MTGCAYRWGTPSRTLPGGHKTVSIPVFKNMTMEPGIEISFTNSLRQEFERSKIARLTAHSEAEAELEGRISSLQYLPGGPKESGMPTGAVLASQYRILIEVEIVLKAIVSGKVLWSGKFSGERTYIAPQVTTAGVNSVNPLYNLSARRQNIDVLATTLMNEAHDRVTENF
jgi:hypothetical protein